MRQTQRVFLTAALCAFLALVAVAAPLAAPQQAAPGAAPAVKIWSGVYTAEQAQNGEATFGSMCARCHAADLSGGQVGAAYAPALGGERFLGAWESRKVTRLYRTIRDTMPRGSPGSLNDQNALELVAYILKYNGFPAGGAGLVADEAALDQIVLIPRAGAVKRQVANFAVVQATGCVARGSNAGWSLTNATEPALAVDGVPADTSRGTKVYRLVSAAPFHLETHTGEMVTIKGLLRVDPDETLLNVTAVQPAGTRCAN
jgi:mono/diheme cytochrome c family protein